mgnify:CR=1 FL=1
MVTNLSGSNIQDTFQQLIHTTDRQNFYTGTGSVVGLVTQNTHVQFTSVTGSINKLSIAFPALFVPVPT